MSHYNLLKRCASYTISNYINLFLLFCIALLSIYFSEVNAKTQIITDFSTGFSVVKNSSHYDSTPQGYEPLGGNSYQLTDTFDEKGISLKHYQTIDLANSDFSISFRLYFGTGKQNSVFQAQGVCFVLSSLEAPWGATTFTNTGWDAIPSFAVEFDTYYDIISYEISDIEAQHLSYLRRGPLTSQQGYHIPPGYYTPLQNNWGNVTTGQWYCCRIKWERDGNGGGTVTTYIEEKWDPLHYGEMIPRGIISFPTLDAMIEGLGVGPNNTLTNWGVCASTGWEPNLQKIEFKQLIIGNNLSDTLPDLTVKFHVFCETYFLFSNDSVDLYKPHPFYASVVLYEPHINYFDNSQCLDILSSTQDVLISSDTIFTFVSPCLVNAILCDRNFLISSTNNQIDSIWVNGVYYKTPYSTNYSGEIIVGQDDSTTIEWQDYKYELTIKLSNGKQYTVMIYNEDRKIASTIASLNPKLNIVVDAKNNTGTIKIKPNNLEYSIQLPPIDSCDYVVGTIDLDTNHLKNFVVPPSIDSNRVLKFKLKDWVCSTIPIVLPCPCFSTFWLKLENNNCDSLCNIVARGFDSLKKDPLFLLGTDYMHQKCSRLSQYTTVAYPINTPISPESFKVKHISGTEPIDIILQNNVMSFIFECPSPCDGIMLICSLEICLVYDNGVECCNQLNIVASCPPTLFSKLNVNPNPVNTNLLYLEMEMSEAQYLKQETLKIDILDQSGNFRFTAFNSVPSQQIWSHPINVSSLGTGLYFIILQYDDLIEAITFIKE